jgi:AcrR family transcriptional regulator
MPAARDTTKSKVADATTANGNGDGNGDGPRRSSLVQERSRRTRQELVNAAVKLWTERGFEHGVENTTVEEIARAAGVTKGTFYFHFAHKEDVLLEMSLTTSDAVSDVARRAAEQGASIDDIVLQAFTEMARRTERLPRAAIARTIREFYKYPTRARELSMTRRVWPELLGEAQERGELPADIDAGDLSDMMNALMITAVEGWVHGAHDALAPELAYRMRVLLAGVRAVHDS